MPVTQEERTALALAALGEVTDPSDVGPLLSIEEVEPGVVDLRFACTLSAYTGWSWTVSTADLPDQEPTVLEVELLPGEGALLAPPWVPWTERLAEWRRQHPDEDQPDDEASDDADAALDDADTASEDEDEDEEVDVDDLAVDDVIDDLDDAELEGEESPEEAEQDAGDISDEDEDDPEAEQDDSAARPALEDRSL